MSPLRERGVGRSAATALQGSHLVELHCTDVALKQYKQEEHWKRGSVPDSGPKRQGKRRDLTVGWHCWKLYLTVVTCYLNHSLCHRKPVNSTL